MRFLLCFALLLFSIVGAAADTAPAERPAMSRIDTGAIYLGPAGAMIERDYFSVPRPQAGATRIFPCTFRLRITRGTTQVVQTCE
jgi:hypothetical protein